MKQNDWIVASINNPNFSSEDLHDVLGLTVDNTLILSMALYETSPYIQNHDAFKNEDGTFNKNKFELFYKLSLSEWDKFTKNEQKNSFEYSLFDTRQNPDSRIRNPNFRIESVLNPDRTTIGVIGWNQEIGKRTLTPSELAQTQKIFDPKTGKYLEETPNDRALFAHPLKWIKNLFEEPLVLATYDKDTEEFDPFYGKVITHKKGEYKLNDEGTYYTEKLNGRSLAGKKVISNSDLVTVDESKINKYDFFDSDSLDKSAVGTILKVAATVAPYFLGAPVKNLYSALLISRELSKTLPMLYGMMTSLFGNENEPEFLNTLAGYGEKFSSGVSEYGQQHTFSFELIGKLMADVATQWGQQKYIAKAVADLKNSNKVVERAYDNAKALYVEQYKKALKDVKLGNLTESETEDLINGFLTGNLNASKAEKVKQFLNIRRMGGLAEDWQNSSFGRVALSKFLPEAQEIVRKNARLGADAALAYMALVSNYDVYNTMLEKGSTHKDAAIVSLLSTVGMFSVDKYLHLGEAFFNELDDLAIRNIRNYSKSEATEWINSMRSGLGMPAELEISGNIFKRITLNASNKNSGVDKKFIIKSMNLGKAIGEEVVNTFKNYSGNLANHSLNAMGKALGEGLEEVSEEFVSDISKQLYEWAGLLGYNTSIKDAGAWDNWFERYAMSLLGGALGGAMFYGVEKYNEYKDGVKNPSDKNVEDEMIYLLRQHRKGDIMNELSKLHKDGKLGSTKLGIRYETVDGNTVFLKAQPNEKTQNDIIYDLLTQSINILDGYLNEYGANLSDDELFKLMVLADDRLMFLKDKLNGLSYMSGYRQEFLDILSNVIRLRSIIETDKLGLTDLLEKRLKASELSEKDSLLKQYSEKNLKIGSYESELKKYEQELNDFLSGKKSLEYARKTTWLADPVMSDMWTYNTFDLWLSIKHNTTIDKLSSAELRKFLSEYLSDLKAKKDFENDKAWESFKDFEAKLNPFLTKLEENSKEILKIKDKFNKISDLRKELYKIYESGYLTIADRVPGESLEDFNNLAIHSENVNNFNNLLRANINNVQKKLNNIVDLFKSSDVALDPQTYRLARDLFRGINGLYAYNYAIKASLYNNDLLNSMMESPLNGVNLEVSFLPKISDLNINLFKNLLTEILTNTGEDINFTGLLSLSNYKNLLKFLKSLNENPIETIKDADFLDTLIDLQIDLDPSLYTELDEVKPEYVELLLNDPNLIIQLQEIVNNKLEKLRTDKLPEFFDESLETNIKLEYINTLIKEILNIKTNDDLIEFISNLTDEKFDKSLSSLVEEISNFIKETISVLNDAGSIDDVSNVLNNTTTDKFLVNLKQLSKDFKLGKNLKEITNKWMSDLKLSILDGVKNNPFIKFLNTSEDIIKEANPLIDLSKILAKEFGLNEDTLESVLDKIQELFDKTDYKDFILNPDEESTLIYLEHLFNIVGGFLYQNTVTPGWLSPFGHARFWNDFVKKHSSELGIDFHLPEIDPDVAELFKSELGSYLKIILAYLEIHNENAINKEQLYIRAQEKLDSAKLQFYKNNLEYFKGIVFNNITVDLLDDVSSTDTILTVETKLANNLYNILEQNNITLKDFLIKSKLIENIIPGGLEAISKLETNDLDDKLLYDDLTPYLKFQFFVSVLLNNSSKFELLNKNKINPETKIAPISILKYIILVGKGFIDSKYITDLLYDYLSEYLNKDNAILKNTLVIEGVGGAGKTKAEIVQIVEDIDDDKIWIAAPNKYLLDNLKSSIQKNPSKTFIKDELMSIILENSAEYNNSINATILDKEAESDNNFRKNSDGRYIDTGNLKLTRILDAPKVLVIDEATHYSSYDIQLIDRWCGENNVRLILSGDGHQLGSKLISGFDNIFTLFKMPRQKTSLRESNIHVQRNNSEIDKVVSFLSKEVENYNVDTKSENLFKELLTQKFSEIELTYYISQDELNGTLITKTLPETFINILKSKYLNLNSEDKEKYIAYVGNPNSDTMKYLKELGINIDEKNIFDSVDKIQSLEFEYVIYDSDLQLKDEDYLGNQWGQIVLDQAKTLYTLNTRGKKGVIIIDNNFLEIYPLANTQSPTTAQAKTISDAVQSFVKKEIERLLNLNLEGEYHDLSELKAPEQSSEEPPADSNDVPEDFEDIEKSQKSLEKKIEKELKDETKIERELDESKSTVSTESTTPKKIYDIDFTMNTIGYFMPILGGFTRVKSDDGLNKYIKLKDEIVGDTTILKDLSVISILDKKIGENEEISYEKLKLYSAKFHRLISEIANVSENLETSGAILSKYITTDHLTKILNGTSKLKLSDGREEGVYLEVVDVSEGDQFIGLTDADENLLTMNGKVYKYVLRFKPTDEDFKGKYEVAITLGLAANPDTWELKLNKLTKGSEEYLKLEEDIKNYREYLLNVKLKKVIITGSFGKERPLKSKIRLDTLHIKSRNKVDYERGWLQLEGLYKTCSDVYILGSDIINEAFGIKVSNSGKAIMFVSNHDYDPEELIDIYIKEKSEKKKCTVRMLILENAGINWSSLTNINYKDLYYESNKITTPFKSGVMGYRLLTAMWNWRADLTNFLNAYKTEFTDLGYDDDKVVNIANAVYELYESEKKSIDNKDEILSKYKVTEDDINKLNNFNDVVCKNIHTFRIGSNILHDKHVLKLNVNPKDYFGTSEIPENVKKFGVKGLYITPQLAKEYLDYIQKTFDVFDSDKGVLDITIYRKDGRESKYSITDRINGDKLGSLTHYKASNSSKANPKLNNVKSDEDGGSLTSQLESNSGIEITDNDGNVYTIYFKDVTLLGAFTQLIIHLYSKLKADAYLAAAGENIRKSSITLIKKDESGNVESKSELDYKPLLEAILNAHNKHFEESKYNSLKNPEDTSIIFEYGNMFDLMLHGSLEDVSTTVKDRENTDKITGVMFPNGMFIDPRAAKGANSAALLFGKTKDKAVLLKTNVNKSLLLIGSTVNLVFNVKLPTLSENKKDSTFVYTFNNNKITLNGTENLENVDQNSIFGDSSLLDLIPGLLELQFNNIEGKAIINNKEYKITKDNNVLYFLEINAVSITDNVEDDILLDSDEESYENLDALKLIQDLNDYDEILSYIKNVFDKNNISYPKDAVIKLENGNINVDDQYYGYFYEDNKDGNIKFGITINPDKVAQSRTDEQLTVELFKTDEEVPTIPKDFNIPMGNIDDTLSNLKFLRDHKDLLKISGKYLDLLNELIEFKDKLDNNKIDLENLSDKDELINEIYDSIDFHDYPEEYKWIENIINNLLCNI